MKEVIKYLFKIQHDAAAKLKGCDYCDSPSRHYFVLVLMTIVITFGVTVFAIIPNKESLGINKIEFFLIFLMLVIINNEIIMVFLFIKKVVMSWFKID